MVEFKTKKRRPNLGLDFTVRRIAQICCSVPMVDLPVGEETVSKARVCKKTDGGYCLDIQGNNWWLHPHDTVTTDGTHGKLVINKYEVCDDEYRYWRLSYRYTTPERQEALEGLAKFLEWELGDV